MTPPPPRPDRRPMVYVESDEEWAARQAADRRFDRFLLAFGLTLGLGLGVPVLWIAWNEPPPPQRPACECWCRP